ncbi:GTPase Der [uncultured archaeon]|nr:GTPase Der [uncultured archaeon]
MGYWETVKRVIEEADIIFEVLDARFPERSRNAKLESLVKGKGKKLAFIINKADLCGKRAVEKKARELSREAPCIFISAKMRQGTNALRKAVGELAGGRHVRIAFCGYPNVGKSSIINRLARKKSAGTSPRAGFTKGMQKIRASKGVMLVDTPGVIPLEEGDECIMAMLGTKNPEQLKDLEGTGLDVAEALLENNREAINEHYKLGPDFNGDAEALLEKIAFSRNRLLKGARPDLNAAAKILINDLQKSEIRIGRKPVEVAEK